MTTPDRDDELNAAEEAALNEYLRRDSAVSQRYREIDAAGVPPSLDHAVLSQARAAIASRKVSRWRGVTRWSASLALAASVVVVVSIVTQPAMKLEVSRPAAPVAAAPPEPVPPKEPARELMVVSPAADSYAPQSPAESSLAKKSVEIEHQVQQRADASARQLAAQAVATPPPALAIETPVEMAPTTAIRQTSSTVPIPPPPPVPAQDVSVTAQRRERAPELEESVTTTAAPAAAPRSAAGPRGTVPVAGVMANVADKGYDEDDPQRWLDAIRQLRAAGESRSADVQWLRFRKKYPDFVVAENDAARPQR